MYILTSIIFRDAIDDSNYKRKAVIWLRYCFIQPLLMLTLKLGQIFNGVRAKLMPTINYELLAIVFRTVINTAVAERMSVCILFPTGFFNGFR